MSANSFGALGLSEPLRRALAAAHYSTPTPVQARAIPPLLEGRDLIAVAQTGTGKTAAFVLPLLQQLAALSVTAEPRLPRALILAPTRELAIQIGRSIATYGRGLGIRHTVVHGGVGQRPQMDALAGRCAILVATPGRLLDLMNQRCVQLRHVRFLVLDEADRMLDLGFIRDVKKIVREVPRERQSLLFSATMPASVAALAGDMLREPVRIDLAPEKISIDHIEQRLLPVDTAQKPALLRSLLQDSGLSRVIVFTRTKHGANRLAAQIGRHGIAVDAIHGNKSQGARVRALEAFRGGRTRVLVATDVAARGLDIAGITHVVNYDFPVEAETYVHRIGRTGRAGAGGVAISFCTPQEQRQLRDVERLTRRRIGHAGSGGTGSKRPRSDCPPTPQRGTPLHAPQRPHAAMRIAASPTSA
jgi:ATP-dependent RNA helicase RhlE